MFKLLVTSVLIGGLLGNPASSQTKNPNKMNRIQQLSRGPQVINVNTSLLFNDAANQKLKDKLMEEADSNLLWGKRVAIITTDGVEEVEITFMYELLRERGARVDVVSPRAPEYPSQFAVEVPPIRDTHILTVHYMENAGWMKIDRFMDEVSADEYDAVIVPGGAWNPDGLRADQHALDFLRAMNDRKKTVAAVCHGPQVLINAGLVNGREVTSWWSMQIDLTNAGGTVRDEAVVVDGNLVTSRAPIDLADFLDAVVTRLQTTELLDREVKAVH